MSPILTCETAHIASSLGAQAAAQHMDSVIGAELLRHQPLDELRRLVPDSPGVLDSRVVPCGGYKTHMGKNYLYMITMETLQVFASPQ